MSVVGLERALHMYTLEPSPAKPFDIKTVPIDAQPMADAHAAPGAAGGLDMGRSSTKKVRCYSVIPSFF